MNTPESHDNYVPHLAQEHVLRLRSRTRGVLNGAGKLLETVEDDSDRNSIIAAMAFIENPTDNIKDVMLHTTNIGTVLVGYEMQGADFPSELDSMHEYLFALQCIRRIAFIEDLLEQGSTDANVIQDAMVRLDNDATLSKDNDLVAAYHELQSVIAAL